MTDTPGDFRDAYSCAFDRYVKDSGEADLRLVYEVGREAVRRQLSVLELAMIHHDVLSDALARTSDPAESDRVMRAAAESLCEALSAFEMVRRGYHEARKTAQLEKQHGDQLRGLADAALAINSTLSIEELFGLATHQAREILNTGCCVATIGGREGSGPAVWIAASPECRSAWRAWVYSSEGSRLLSLVHSKSSPARLGRAAIEGSSRWRELAELSDRHSSGGWLGVPLMGGDRVLGSLQLFDKSGGHFSDNDESVLVQLAQMAAVALENVQLYESERRTAETLQRALLPERLPDPAGITVAARYLPGASGVNVGGDWYDVVLLSDERTGIGMGDVVGRGAQAASVMGRVRTGWRAYALGGERSDVVVRKLNTLIQDLDQGHFSTMVHAVVETDERRMRIVNAGHPPPLLVRPDGQTRFVHEGLSVPLGVLSEGGYRSEIVPLDAGYTVAIYTDGLVERPDEVLDRGFRRLEEAIADPGADLEALCDRVLDRMLPEEPADDVALLMFRLG